MPKELLNESAYNELTENTKCIVQFTANWCGPCKSLKPILEDLSNRYEIDFATVDITDNAEFAKSKGIQGIPYVEVYSCGDLKDTFVGLKNKQQLEEILNVYFG